MFFVGRLIRHFDARLVIAAGFAVTAVSLWQMCNFYLGVSDELIAWSGLVQGIGMGLAYVPLTAVTFATLSPQFRNEGTAIFNLLRNIGSAVGIAAVQALLTRNAQVMHARLAEHVTPYGAHLDVNSARELGAMNARVTAQAAMIAYNNDFKLMLLLSLAAIPLVFLFRKVRPGKQAVVVAE
jgi:DHA2 family multidrug resistance protein